MIFGNINNFEETKSIFPEAILKALNFLKESNFNEMEVGVYNIDGDNIYAQVFDIVTKDKNIQKPETHEKYIDIQYSVSGNEIIGFAVNTGNNKISESLLEERDIIFYENAENEFDLKMNIGDFVVFFPNDVHRPACICESEKNIRKVVVKVKVSSL